MGKTSGKESRLMKVSSALTNSGCNTSLTSEASLEEGGDDDDTLLREPEEEEEDEDEEWYRESGNEGE